MGGDKGGEQQRWAAEMATAMARAGQRRASGVQAAALIRRSYLGALMHFFGKSVCPRNPFAPQNRGRPRRWGRDLLVRVV